MSKDEALVPTVVRHMDSNLTKDAQKQLDKLTIRLRMNLQSTVENMVQIGRDLLAAKEIVGHGKFEAWLNNEFDLSDQTARRFMHVVEAFGDQVDAVKTLGVSSVYALSAPSTPKAVRETVISMVQAGKNLRHVDIKALIDKASDAPGKGSKDDSAFRSTLKSASHKLNNWTQAFEEDWAELNGTIRPKSKQELEKLHSEMAQLVQKLEKMLAEAKEDPGQKRGRKPSVKSSSSADVSTQKPKGTPKRDSKPKKK